jgi:hypothetical protein
VDFLALDCRKNAAETKCDSIRDSPTYRVHQKPTKGFAKIFADFGILAKTSKKISKKKRLKKKDKTLPENPKPFFSTHLHPPCVKQKTPPTHSRTCQTAFVGFYHHFQKGVSNGTNDWGTNEGAHRTGCVQGVLAVVRDKLRS